MAEHPPFSVSVVTPEGAAFEGEARDGDRAGRRRRDRRARRHAPLVALLKAGSTRVHVGEGDIREFATGPASSRCSEDRAIALVDAAVIADEIDEAKVQRQLEEAQAELERADRGESDADRWQLEQKILHAENQLRVIGRG